MTQLEPQKNVFKIAHLPVQVAGLVVLTWLAVQLFKVKKENGDLKSRYEELEIMHEDSERGLKRWKETADLLCERSITYEKFAERLTAEKDSLRDLVSALRAKAKSKQ
jgi:hypothetical protein